MRILTVLATALILSPLAQAQNSNNVKSRVDALEATTADLQNQIDTIELTPGPVGPAGTSCSVAQQGNGAVITCEDGSEAAIAGTGTVIVYPEGQTGEVPPIDYNTGPVVAVDQNEEVLGEILSIWQSTQSEYFQIKVTQEVRRSLYVANVDWLGETETLYSSTSTYYLSDDCSGPVFNHGTNQVFLLDGKTYMRPVESTYQNLLFNSYRSSDQYWLNTDSFEFNFEQWPCETTQQVLRAYPSIEYTPAQEITNAVYPIRAVQLPGD